MQKIDNLSRIWLQFITKENGNAIPLSVDDHRKIPCRYLMATIFKPVYVLIEYDAVSGTAKEDVIRLHVNEFSKLNSVVGWQEVEFQNLLQNGKM